MILRLFVLMALAALVGCSGMPKGIEMSAEERIICEATRCTVWTDEELKSLFLQGVQKGYAYAIQHGT